MMQKNQTSIKNKQKRYEIRCSTNNKTRRNEQTNPGKRNKTKQKNKYKYKAFFLKCPLITKQKQ